MGIKTILPLAVRGRVLNRAVLDLAISPDWESCNCAWQPIEHLLVLKRRDKSRSSRPASRRAFRAQSVVTSSDIKIPAGASADVSQRSFAALHDRGFLTYFL